MKRQVTARDPRRRSTSFLKSTPPKIPFPENTFGSFTCFGIGHPEAGTHQTAARMSITQPEGLPSISKPARVNDFETVGKEVY
ncbi:MAG: hypothetical protein K7J46_15870 [Bryobacter sp.]|jgi:hypothetical protein|nr:hypothetical protein [Bryobacter sp. CoA8 C33]